MKIDLSKIIDNSLTLNLFINSEKDLQNHNIIGAVVITTRID